MSEFTPSECWNHAEPAGRYLLLFQIGYMPDVAAKYSPYYFLALPSLMQERITAYYKGEARDAAMRDLGLVKVRGALGGVYWE